MQPGVVLWLQVAHAFGVSRYAQIHTLACVLNHRTIQQYVACPFLHSKTMRLSLLAIDQKIGRRILMTMFSSYERSSTFFRTGIVNATYDEYQIPLVIMEIDEEEYPG